MSAFLCLVMKAYAQTQVVPSVRPFRKGRLLFGVCSVYPQEFPYTVSVSVSAQDGISR